MNAAKRFCSRKIETAKRDDGKTVIAGYGAVFYRAGDPGTEYKLWNRGVERIMPGAFARAVAEDDIRSLFNHDSNIVLGRVRAGTLTLSVDEIGLRYEVTPPDTQLVRDQVIAPIARGDVSGSSFMFLPIRETWIEEERDGWMFDIRQIEEVELRELGPVTFPAYESATSGVRGDTEEAKASHAAWREVRDSKREQSQAVSIRARAVEVDFLEGIA